jgi:phosphate transport system substrate-binding protein
MFSPSRPSRRALSAFALTLGSALLIAGCGSTSSVGQGADANSSAGFGQQICGQAANTQPHYPAPPQVPGGAPTVSGAGSTFVAPVMSDWTKAYSQQVPVQVSYQSIGSGGGVAQIQAGTVDFGQSDTGMSAADLAKAKGPILQVPLLLGGVVPAYHINGVGPGLKFTGDVLGKIYAGQIKTWNDPAITGLNPGVALPAEPIAVAHRSDGSGTTGIWTDYLTKESPTWAQTLGGPAKSSGKDVAWPTGIGGKGNEGVSGVINQTEGSIGYLELQYAVAQQTTYGQVQNKAGKFVQPCIATVTKAVNGINFPPSLNTSLTDGADPDVYPISGTSYALVYQDQPDKAKAASLVNFMNWVLTTGQDRNAALNYAPLGANLQQLAADQVKKITSGGVPVAP